MAKMTKGLLLTCAIVTSYLAASAQLYYKDIVTTFQINQTYKDYKDAKVTGVKLTSFNGDVPITEGFEGRQEVSYTANSGKIVTYTKTSDVGENFIITTYNQQDKLVKTQDSTSDVVTVSTYQYNADNRLAVIRSDTRATDGSSVTSEVHNWQYNAAGRPAKMIRIKNGTDTTTINFTLDEKGNVVEEEAFKKNLSQGKVYYYYDAKNQLTDVVKYNVRARKLLPDYIFEYDEDGYNTVMTLIPEGSNEYFKWYYQYADNGLKTKEVCYNKRNELQGKVEYSYTFAK